MYRVLIRNSLGVDNVGILKLSFEHDDVVEDELSDDNDCNYELESSDFVYRDDVESSVCEIEEQPKKRLCSMASPSMTSSSFSLASSNQSPVSHVWATDVGDVLTIPFNGSPGVKIAVNNDLLEVDGVIDSMLLTSFE